MFEPPFSAARPAEQYRNPIALAQEWQRLLAAEACTSRADLAGRLGVTRARVTQVLDLLALAPEVVIALAELGDPLLKPTVSERRLRPLLKLPAADQQQALQAIVQS